MPVADMNSLPSSLVHGSMSVMSSDMGSLHDLPLVGHDLDVALHSEVHAGVVCEYVHAEVVDDRVLVEVDRVFDLEARAELLEEPPNLFPRTPYEEIIALGE